MVLCSCMGQWGRGKKQVKWLPGAEQCQVRPQVTGTNWAYPVGTCTPHCPRGILSGQPRARARALAIAMGKGGG